MASEIQSRALPKGSLILVTGASGYIGAHVVNEALQAGYKVRGTARSEEKAAWTREVLKQHANYSTAVVADFQHDGTFDEAIQGCDAVIHVASDTTFGHDPNQVITGTVAGVLSLLKSAAKTPSVQRFVLTSSSTAAYLPKANEEISLTVDSWNQEALDLAWAPPPYTPERAFPVYAASKTEGEKALWTFMREQKPHFVANSILPNLNIGRILTAGGPTGDCLPKLWKGELPFFPPQYMIDVIDDARLHLVAAALDPSLQNERIFAFNISINWTDIIATIRELYPHHQIPDAQKDEPRDLAKVPNELGARLLKTWYGQETGYKPLKQSVKENLEGLAE